MRKGTLAILALFVLCSCATQKELYNWKGYDDAVYSFTRASDQKSLENLMGVYEKLINTPGGSRNTPPPGVYADYGYLLIMNGKRSEGMQLLDKEVATYPESKQLIDRILKRLEE